MLTSWTVTAENFALTLDTIVSPGVPGPGAGNIPTYTATDVYSFQGTNGQVVFLEGLSVSAAFGGWLQWDLKSPTSVTLFSSYFDGQPEGRRVLPANGTYTITVRVGASNPSYIGDYSFRVRTVTPDQYFPITLGNTVQKDVPAPGAGNIDVAGAHDVYQFNAAAGDLVFLEKISAAASFENWLQWEIRSPGGTLVSKSFFSSGNDGRRVLPETGVYTIRVSDGDVDPTHIGDYAFRVRPIPPDQSFALNFGQVYSNSVPLPGAGYIEAAGAQDVYTFTASAGQNVFFDDTYAAPAFEGWMKWEARSPSGQLVFSEYMGGTPAGRRTLSEAGVYTIKCFDASSDPDHIGAYAFRVQNLDDAEVPLAIGQLVTNGVPAVGAGNIEQAGNQDVYTFSATAGQRVVFHEIAAAAAFAGWLKLELRSPSSNQVFSVYLQPGRTNSYVMPETGIYKLRAYAGAANTSYLGTYSFRTWCDVFAVPNKFETVPGTPFSMPKSTLICNDRWEVGDVVSVDLPSSATAQGGTINETAGSLVYVPPTGFSGTDTFMYRLTGILGDWDTNVVHVQVGQNFGYHGTVTGLVRTGPDSAKACLKGAPGQAYDVERSADLATWSKTGEISADSEGAMVFNYTNNVGDKAFYRFMRRP